MSALNSEVLASLGAMQGAEAVLSLQLAFWQALTGVDRIIARGQIVDVPRFSSAGEVEREIEDPKMAAAMLYECTVLRPREMIEAQRQLAERARQLEDADEQAQAEIAEAQAQLAEAEAELDAAET